MSNDMKIKQFLGLTRGAVRLTDRDEHEASFLLHALSLTCVAVIKFNMHVLYDALH